MAGRKQQDYTALPFFLTRTEWDKLLQSQDKWTRLGAVLQVASLLGLRSPSEPSMAVFFGLVHPNFREEDALSLNQSFCVFKDEVRQELLTLNADLSPPARLAQDRLRAPRHLPQELLTLVYSQGEMPLSELPIDKKQFYRKVSNLPLRKSHGRVQAQTAWATLHGRAPGLQQACGSGTLGALVPVPASPLPALESGSRGLAAPVLALPALEASSSGSALVLASPAPAAQPALPAVAAASELPGLVPVAVSPLPALQASSSATALVPASTPLSVSAVAEQLPVPHTWACESSEPQTSQTSPRAAALVPADTPDTRKVEEAAAFADPSKVEAAVARFQRALADREEAKGKEQQTAQAAHKDSPALRRCRSKTPCPDQPAAKKTRALPCQNDSKDPADQALPKKTQKATEAAATTQKAKSQKSSEASSAKQRQPKPSQAGEAKQTKTRKPSHGSSSVEDGPRQLSTSTKCVASRAYHKARNEAIRAGKTTEAATELARAAHRRVYAAAAAGA